MAKRKKNPKIFLIEEYYKTLGNKLKWDDQKILHLCESTLMEVEELRALLRMTEAGFRRMMFTGPNKQVSILLYQVAVNKGYYAPYPTPSSK